jgi:hypothetical protein
MFASSLSMFLVNIILAKNISIWIYVCVRELSLTDLMYMLVIGIMTLCQEKVI